MSFTVRPVREERKSDVRFKKYVLLAAAFVQSIFHLYRWKKERNQKERKELKRIATLKKTVTVLLAVLIAFLLIIGTLRVLLRLKAFSLTGMFSAVSADLPADENGHTNVLLLGVGDSNHDGVDLTDTIMVASLDPAKTRSAVLLSLPRDLYILNSEKMGKGRINDLYRDYKSFLISQGSDKAKASGEAMKQLAKEIGSFVDLPIHGVIKINFSGFTQAVDAIGGVDVFVPEDISDPEYPGPNYTFETFALTKGPQHLSGETALQYVRSRHSTSDFSRSARQQQVMAAAAAKVRGSGLLKNASKMTDLLSIISKNMETTFTTRELFGLAGLGQKIDQKKIVSTQLSDQNGLYDGPAGRGGFLYAPPREQFEGASILLPVSMPEMPVTWKQIRSLSRLLFENRELFVRPPAVAVLNAGAREGSARKLAGELYKYGFNVVDSRNFLKGDNPSFEKSFVAVYPSQKTEEATEEAANKLSKAEDNADFFKKLFKFSSPLSTVDIAAFGENPADIIIVLGKDYRFGNLQDLILTSTE